VVEAVEVQRDCSEATESMKGTLKATYRDELSLMKKPVAAEEEAKGRKWEDEDEVEEKRGDQNNGNMSKDEERQSGSGETRRVLRELKGKEPNHVIEESRRRK
jgi:hypothetical protein